MNRQDDANRKAGESIRNLRMLRGMSQEELALKSGINDQSTISKLERNGPQILSWRQCMKVAEALDCIVQTSFVPIDER